MATRKPGIFDPWRQEAPPIVPVREVRVATDIDPVELTPIRFAGRRAGLVVWLPGDDPEEIALAARTNVLAAVLSLRAEPALRAVFDTWGISDGNVPAAHTVMSDGSRTVTILGDYQKALDSLAFALRESARAKPTVEPYLTSLGIRPYIV